MASRAVYRAALQALSFSGRVETAFVERLNLTLRELIAPLSRRSWSIADDIPTLWRHVGVYYHFCRPHESLTHRSRCGRFRYRTPAMAAGVVHRRFGVSELLLMLVYALRSACQVPTICPWRSVRTPPYGKH